MYRKTVTILYKLLTNNFSGLYKNVTFFYEECQPKFQQNHSAEMIFTNYYIAEERSLIQLRKKAFLKNQMIELILKKLNKKDIKLIYIYLIF